MKRFASILLVSLLALVSLGIPLMAGRTQAAVAVAGNLQAAEFRNLFATVGPDVDAIGGIGAEHVLPGRYAWLFSITNYYSVAVYSPTITVTSSLDPTYFPGVTSWPVSESKGSISSGETFHMRALEPSTYPGSFTAEFDSSRAVTPALVPAGLSQQTVTVTVRPGDRYNTTGAQLWVRVSGKVVEGSNTQPQGAVVEGPLPEGGIVWRLDRSAAPGVWVGTEYTFSVRIEVYNPTSAEVPHKPPVGIHMTPHRETAKSVSNSTNAEITDAVLLGTITYSVADNRNWVVWDFPQEGWELTYQGLAIPVPPPAPPPNGPTNLVATAASSSQINLTWQDNSLDELGFKIERKTGAATYAQIATVGANVTNFSDPGLLANTTYYYRVKAYNAAGDSAYSTEAQATTLPPPPPNGPTDLVATAVSSSQINLTWQDNSPDELGFKIERKTGEGGAYAQIASVGANVTGYNDTGLLAENTYYYRVKAYNAAGDSAYSHEACATTLAPPRATSTNITVPSPCAVPLEGEPLKVMVHTIDAATSAGVSGPMRLTITGPASSTAVVFQETRSDNWFTVSTIANKLAAGSYTATGEFLGTADYAPSSATITMLLGPCATATSLTLSPTQAFSGDPIQAKVHVSGAPVPGPMELTVTGPAPSNAEVFKKTQTSDTTGSAVFTFSLSDPGTYTVTGKFLGAVVLNDRGDHSGYLASEATATLQVLVVTPPPFSQIFPLPSPGACISTPMVETHAHTGLVHNWFAKADSSGKMYITLVAMAVNATDPETAVAKVYGPSGNELLPPLTASYTAPSSLPFEVRASRQITTTAGAIYRIVVTTPPPTPGSQSHYRLEFKGAVEAGTNSPTFASLGRVGYSPDKPPTPVRWIVNVNSPEELQLRIFSSEFGPATKAVVRLIRPDGSAETDWTTLEGPSPGAPFDRTLTVSGAADGPWRLLVREMEGHYKLDKLSGTDRGIYVSWNAYGFGSITGTILHGGSPFLGPVQVNLYRLAPVGLAPFLEKTLWTSTGSFSFPKQWVGGYRVEVVPPAGFKADPASRDVTVAVCPPVAVSFQVNGLPTANPGGPYSGNEGSPVSFNGLSSSDPDGDLLTYAWSFGDGGTGTGATPSHTYADNGTYTVKLTVTDPGGLSDTKSTTATIANVGPASVWLSPSPVAIDENGTTTLSGSFTDPGTLDTHTVVVNWGDGSLNTTLNLAANVVTFSASHQYLDNKPANVPYTISVTVTDKDGASGSGSIGVTVNNVAPSVGPITAPIEPVAVNTAISASASFTDLGVRDTHAATWDWGDGTSIGTIIESKGSGSVSDSHTYTAAGVYVVKLTVTDKDGGTGSAEYRYVVIYNPEGGFVTGGGWINSPAGAYTPNPSLTGKANFGFVSKYEKGATVPTGQTEFQFKVADLNFHSKSYQWLVIAGAKAQYKGVGTINGAGEYGFMLTAIDGQMPGGGGADKFRIKIWDRATGSLVYDNKMDADDTADPDTVLGGGSIVIHKG